jgi:hypothetical protein
MLLEMRGHISCANVAPLATPPGKYLGQLPRECGRAHKALGVVGANGLAEFEVEERNCKKNLRKR